MNRTRRSLLAATTAIVGSFLAATQGAHAQQQLTSKVDIAFNRYYDYDALVAQCRRLAEAYPDLVRIEELGQSVQGRTLIAIIINNPKTGPDSGKPAMYIDGNIHGNEIQAGEVVLYSAWYLASGYGQVERITKLVDESAFYLIPSINPDGRQFWFDNANTSSSSRGGQKPTDNDRDGAADEDGPEDLDGDGAITTMWRPDPNGSHKRSETDPNRMEPVTPAIMPDGTVRRGEWSFAGSEGIDNDGDGSVNEDGPGGYDPNRNWPADWQPNHVQDGAGDYPLSLPESRCVAAFIMRHPNIAAGQSYHNAGGMILRGPGAQEREGVYGGRDRSTYDAIATSGEQMLPFYRKMVIWSDLYTVHGGFVNWLAESLGVVSFTNEMWSENRIMQNGASPNEEQERLWREHVLFGQTSLPLKEVDHPTLGKVLVGGSSKYSSRIPPPFMAEEEYHRNFAFTMFHAAQMPKIRFASTEVKDLGNGLWQVDVEIANDRLIPTRTERAAARGIGQPDRLRLTGASVVLGGFASNRFAKTVSEQRFRPATLEVEDGIPGRSSRFFRFVVRGNAGDTVGLSYVAEKASPISASVSLAPTANAAATGTPASPPAAR
ncbi:MAG: peptidase M14 [Phycisphaerae bacterium]|jgi:hypothetical protein|nr:peptidase M14 [Phycisphaerae bacterium]